MSKNAKVGRRPAVILVPSGTFTMADWLEHNDKNGNKITMLTLRKRQKEFIVKVKGENAEPDHKKGLGRKCFVFRAKAGVTTGKSVAKATAKAATPAKSANLRKARKSSVTQTLDTLNAKKAELGNAEPAQAPAEPVPVTAPVDAPASAPVAEPVAA